MTTENRTEEIRAVLGAPFVKVELSEAMTWGDQRWHPSARLFTRDQPTDRWKQYKVNVIAGETRADLLRSLAALLDGEDR